MIFFILSVFFLFQMFSLTAENLFRSLLQCVIVKGTFLSDKQPKLQGCFEGPHETWTHSGVSMKLVHGNIFCSIVYYYCFKCGAEGTLLISHLVHTLIRSG
jgi:hypothetical protein